MGGTGIEPATSSVSRKRATTAPTALEVGTGFEPVYTALQAAASPLGQPTLAKYPCGGKLLLQCDVGKAQVFLCLFHRADDGTRTRDPHLGKVMLYQLSYIRDWPPA